MRSWTRNLCPKPAAVKDIQETPTKLADRGHARPQANDDGAHDTERSSQPSARPAELPTELRCRDCRDSTVGRPSAARLADDHAFTGPGGARSAGQRCLLQATGGTVSARLYRRNALVMGEACSSGANTAGAQLPGVHLWRPGDPHRA